MTVTATDSALDIAYWFIQKAERDHMFLDNEKLFHLIFLAHVTYAKTNKTTVLSPCLFICDENGFTEPNLKRMFSMGRPFMPLVKLENNISSFLETIWNKYISLTTGDFIDLIKNSAAYKEYYKVGEKNLVSVNEILDKFTTNKDNNPMNFTKKIRLSQNGPVVVSKWNPRKL